METESPNYEGMPSHQQESQLVRLHEGGTVELSASFA
jgi:hypothetical protein